MRRLAYLAWLRFRAPSKTDNVAYNRFYWNLYAKRWDDPVVREQGADIRTDQPVDYEAFDVLGQEWGVAEELTEVIAEFVEPYVDQTMTAAEIGVGGGRVALRVAPLVRELWGFDIAPAMLERAGKALAGTSNVRLALLEGPSLPAELTARLDFLYSFDVFVHLDVHTQWRYFREAARVLKPGGHLFLHTSNLTTEEGWKLFAGEPGYAVEGFYFVTPEVVRTLAGRAGLEVVKESSPGSPNYYYDRDHLVVLRKP